MEGGAGGGITVTVKVHYFFNGFTGGRRRREDKKQGTKTKNTSSFTSFHKQALEQLDAIASMTHLIDSLARFDMFLIHRFSYSLRKCKQD